MILSVRLILRNCYLTYQQGLQNILKNLLMDIRDIIEKEGSIWQRHNKEFVGCNLFSEVYYLIVLFEQYLVLSIASFLIKQGSKNMKADNRCSKILDAETCANSIFPSLCRLEFQCKTQAMVGKFIESSSTLQQCERCKMLLTYAKYHETMLRGSKCSSAEQGRQRHRRYG